jgi:DNA polymerase-1
MVRDTKKLVAIDGNSLLYRAFFAMRYLSTSDGIPTNAVYGLTTMLLKVLEEKPDYIAVAFDTPKPTFRHEEYDLYKANRAAPPDDLIQQGPSIFPSWRWRASRPTTSSAQWPRRPPGRAWIP